MIAFTAHRLIFVLRLVVVAALAGYMLPTVSFAMHGDIAASYVQQSVQADQHAAHSHDSGAALHDHGGQTADHHEKKEKQDCCSNFCLSLALVGDVTQFSLAKASPSRVYTNDDRAFAAPIRLNRPPAFRT